MLRDMTLIRHASRATFSREKVLAVRTIILSNDHNHHQIPIINNKNKTHTKGISI